jgi:hypothetical protein
LAGVFIANRNLQVRQRQNSALAPEQRQKNDDGQRNAQQPKQRASTETHDLSSSFRCVQHQRFAAFWVPLEIGGDVCAAWSIRRW